MWIVKFLLMIIDDIPEFIRESGVFNSDQLLQLATIERVPTPIEIDNFAYEPEVQELLNAFIGDPQTRRTHQLQQARVFLMNGRVIDAWKIALL